MNKLWQWIKNKSKDGWWYLKQSNIEEWLCRIIVLGYLPNRIGIIVSTIVYSLMHFILFKWQVAVLCVPFGLVLGWTYLSITHPTNAIIVLVFHFLVGAVAWNWIKKYRR